MPKQKLPPKYFIWTPELAYTVGLLVTDGNLSGDGRHICMRSAEIPILETFEKCLGLENKIGKDKGRPYYRVQFGSIQFYNWLLKIGLTPAKSLTIGAIDVPDEFFRDYFRGCIDGDGGIRTYLNTYNVYKGRRYTTQCLFIRLFSASEKHLIWAQSRLKHIANVHGAIIQKRQGDEHYAPFWELKFAKKESLRLINWMYYDQNIPCLQRKRKIAQLAVGIINRQKRREYTWIDKPKQS